MRIRTEKVNLRKLNTLFWMPGPWAFFPIGFKSKRRSFRAVRPGYNDFHRAPKRQLMVLLNGGVEIET